MAKMAQKYFFGSLKLTLIYKRKFESFFDSLCRDYQKVWLHAIFNQFSVCRTLTQNRCRQQRSVKAVMAAKKSYKLTVFFLHWKEITEKNAKKRNLVKMQRLYVKQKFLSAWVSVYCKSRDEDKKQYAAKAFYTTVLVSKLFKTLKMYAVHHKLEGISLLSSNSL